MHAHSSEQPTHQPEGRCAAILIGIDDYQHGIPRLRNAVRDVHAVARVLKDKHQYEIRLMLNNQATLAALRTLLTALPSEISADTRLVLYFAGHGIAEEIDHDATGPQGFLIPQDARRDDPATFWPMAEVQKLLSKLPCKHLLLVLDCCFAGAFRWSQTRSLRLKPATLYRERYERYLRDPAWQVITSAASDETALDTVAGGKLGRRDEDAENSPFAAALCQGLRGDADLRVGGQPGDGVIVANELHVYLESAFERLEQQLQRTVQKPLLWSLAGKEKGQFIFLTPNRRPALPSALELVEKNSPYQGLEPYGEDKADLFFGRYEVVQDLLEQVKTNPLTVVSGVSGSGKSSVVRAGLVSRLRKASDWLILPMVRPGNRPLSALSSVYGELGASLQSDLAASVVTWRAQNANSRLLLIIDQLEELLTMGATSAEQQSFLDDIHKALSEHDGYLHVVMTLRSDFEPHFVELLTSRPGVHVRFLVRPLNRQELRQVIECPASERVLYFEPASLVDQLIDEVAEMPGALPLLSFTMSELYRAYVRSGRSDRCLSALDYQKLKGVAGALSQRADEILESLDVEQQATLRWVMLRMVALEAGEVARRRVPRHELRYGQGYPEESRVSTVLQRLQEARLVVAGKDSEGVPYVEPAHDKLVLGWPKLWSFIKQEQENIPLHRLLTVEATAWDKAGRDANHLWSSNPRLPLLVDLRQKMPERFNALENEFILNSQAAQQRLLELERRRRQELEESLAQAREQKRIAEEALEKTRQLLLDTYIERGHQLLFKENQPHQAALWLHRAYKEGSKNSSLPHLLKSAMLHVDAIKVILRNHGSSDWSAQFSPDGRRIVTDGHDKTARIWNAESGHMLAELTGHRGAVQFPRFSRDGQRIFAVTKNEEWVSDEEGAQVLTKLTCMVAVWGAEDGRLLAEIAGHEDLVLSATFSPDGQRLLTASSDQTARLWDAVSGSLLIELRGHGSTVNSATFSPDGRRIVTASDDKTARVWDTESGRLLTQFTGHEDRVTSATFNLDGRCIITASNDKTARVWDAGSGRLLAQLVGHTDWVASAAFSPDGQRIVTASNDKTARVWDAGSGRLLTALTGHGSTVKSATFGLDGRNVLTVSSDQTARIWDAEHGWLLAELRGEGDHIASAMFSPDSRRIVVASADHTAQVWNFESGRLLAELTGHRDNVWSATFSPDGQRILTASSDRTARLWQAESWRLLAELTGHKGSVVSATFSPNGRRIATASEDAFVRVWDSEDWRLLAELTGHKGSVVSATFSSDSQRILTASSDRTARLWQAESGRLLAELTGHKGSVVSAAFSPNSRCIVTASEDETARVWNADGGRLLTELRGPSIGGLVSATFSPDNQCILTAARDHTARVWDRNSGRLLFYLTGHGGTVWSAMYSWDGRSIVTASDDHTARVWAAADGRLLAELTGHRDSVVGATFSLDSRHIVTASRDQTARLWDSADGRLLAVLTGHCDLVNNASYSPDAHYIITASQDHTARVWDASPESRTPEQLAQVIRRRARVRFEPEDGNVIVPCTPPSTGVEERGMLPLTPAVR